MKRSRVIALSAISAGFAVLFMLAGAVIPVLDYSAIFMASLCTMIPLAKKSWQGGLMTYLATSLLCFIFFIGVNPAMVVTFAIFFGAHPTVSFILRERRLNNILSMAIKTLWFVASAIVIYVFFSSFLFEESILTNQTFQKFAYLIVGIGGGLLFIVYDLLITRFQGMLDKTIEKLKL